MFLKAKASPGIWASFPANSPFVDCRYCEGRRFKSISELLCRNGDSFLSQIFFVRRKSKEGQEDHEEYNLKNYLQVEKKLFTHFLPKCDRNSVFDHASYEKVPSDYSEQCSLNNVKIDKWVTKQCLMTNTFNLDKQQLFLLMFLFLSSLGQKRKPNELEMRVIQKYIYKRSNEPMRPFEMRCSCQWANIRLQFIHNSSTHENNFSCSMAAGTPLLNFHFVGPTFL